MQEKQNKEFISHFPWAGGPPSLGNWGCIKCNHHSNCSPFLLPPSLYTGHHVVWDVSGSFGASSPCCVPSQLLVCPQPTLLGQREQQKSHLHCLSTAQQYWKHLHIINPLFRANPKHSSTLSNTLRKV